MTFFCRVCIQLSIQKHHLLGLCSQNPEGSLMTNRSFEAGSLSQACSVTQIMVLFEGFRDLLCRLTGAESTETIVLMMKLLKIILHILDCGIRMVPELWYKVKTPKVLDAQQTFCEGISLAC
jgi:hypothetical protein